MTREEFVAEYQQLLGKYIESDGNSACISVTDCRHCISCVFCTGCVRGYRLTHCTECVDSALLTHCTRCRESTESTYCVDCDHCSRCNYVVRSAFCAECDYCYGCVGLVGKEFHILNQKYSRGEYFRTVATLEKAFAQAAAPQGGETARKNAPEKKGVA